MANAWPQRALGPWPKKRGALSSPARYYCWVGIGPPFVSVRERGPKGRCGHVLAMFGPLIDFVIK